MGRSARGWKVPDRVYESLVTWFSDRVSVVDGTLVFHVPDPAEERIQNGRKPDGVGFATALRPF